MRRTFALYTEGLLIRHYWTFLTPLLSCIVFHLRQVRTALKHKAAMSQNNNAAVSVERVTEAKALRQFLALPHRIYASDPAWIAPLNFMKREQLSKANDFFWV